MRTWYLWNQVAYDEQKRSHPEGSEGYYLSRAMLLILDSWAKGRKWKDFTYSKAIRIDHRDVKLTRDIQ